MPERCSKSWRCSDRARNRSVAVLSSLWTSLCESHNFLDDKQDCFCMFLKYALEMEAKLDQLRRLVETADRDKVELMNQLEEEKR